MREKRRMQTEKKKRLLLQWMVVGRISVSLEQSVLPQSSQGGAEDF